MKSVVVYAGVMSVLAGALPPAQAEVGSAPSSGVSRASLLPSIPTLVPAPEWKSASPADKSLRSDVRALVAEPPRTSAEARKLLQSALRGDGKACAKVVAYWKGRRHLRLWEAACLVALSQATYAPARGAVDMPLGRPGASLSKGRMTPPLPMPLREQTAEERERLAALPHSAWSTEELSHAALRGDERAVAELAYYWACRRKLAESAGERRTPWYSDAEHWSGHWIAAWRSGRSYGVLASRLEEGATLDDLETNPAWAELMRAAAREAEGDAVRDSLQFVAEALPRMTRRAAARALREARREGIALLRSAARRGVRGAAARYHAVTVGGSNRETHEALGLLCSAADAGDVAALRALAAVMPADQGRQLRARAVELGDVQAMRDELASLGGESERASLLRRQLASRGDLEELMRSAEAILDMPPGPDRDAKLSVAESYLKRASEQGFGRASMLLCRLYEGEFGGVASPEKACVAARGMVAAHYAPGYLKMAEYKERGYGNCSRDLAEAYALIEAAARSRMPDAMVQWARALLRGIGTSPDPASAAHILDYVRSVAPETPSLNFYLGYLYELGVGKPRDLGKALRYYTAGVEQGDSRAMNNLASMYESGVGVVADRQKALELYRQAADLGNEDGRANYARLKAGK